MNDQAFEQLKEKTRNFLRTLPEGAYEFELRLQTLAIRLLAKGEPVTPEMLSTVWEMPSEQVKMLFEQARSQGTLELDEDGNMIGTAISLVPTNHIFRINGNTLYAWCAYDSVYAAGVTGKHVLVETFDPYSNQAIHITITPEGISERSPKSVVVTYVSMEADIRGGANSPRCSQMNFFASEENARLWLSGQGDVSILTVDQLREFVEEFQVGPAKRLGLIGKSREFK